MAYNFLPYDTNTMFLLPPSIADWVRDDSLARLVSQVVDDFDGEGRLELFFKRYRRDGWGHPAFHPRMMVKVLLYGYCVGVQSSRRIARALETDIAFRYLSANQRPDFRTLAQFRKDNLKAFEGLFSEVLRLCQEAGLAKMGRVALDGRKVAGNAALDRNRTKAAIEEEIAKILAEAERTDREEDEQYGEDKRGDELPEELSTESGRATGLRRARARMEENDREEKAREAAEREKKEAEAREAKRREAERLSRLEEARRQLEEIERAAKEEQARKIAERQKAEEETGQKKRGRKPLSPEEVVNHEAKANITDPDSRILKSKKGYLQGYNGQAMADCDSQVIVSCGVTQEANDVKQLIPMLERCLEQAGRLPIETLADAGYCSDANLAQDGRGTRLFIATTKDWKQRKALRDQPSPRGRIPRSATRRDRMERKLLTQAGRKKYKQRGSTIEPVFGQMHERGLNHFLLRGVENVSVEWSMWCTTHNFLKLWRSGRRIARVSGLIAKKVRTCLETLRVFRGRMLSGGYKFRWDRFEFVPSAA